MGSDVLSYRTRHRKNLNPPFFHTSTGQRWPVLLLRYKNVEYNGLSRENKFFKTVKKFKRLARSELFKM